MGVHQVGYLVVLVCLSRMSSGQKYDFPPLPPQPESYQPNYSATDEALNAPQPGQYGNYPQQYDPDEYVPPYPPQYLPPQNPPQSPQYPPQSPEYPPQYPPQSPQYSPKSPQNSHQYPPQSPQYPPQSPQYPTTPVYPTQPPQYPQSQYPPQSPPYDKDAPRKYLPKAFYYGSLGSGSPTSAPYTNPSSASYGAGGKGCETRPSAQKNSFILGDYEMRCPHNLRYNPATCQCDYDPNAPIIPWDSYKVSQELKNAKYYKKK